MKTDSYVALQTLTMHPCDLTENSYLEAKRTWLCSGCCVPRPAVRTIDAFLEEQPTDKPINFVNGCGLSVVHRQFLEAFPDDVIQCDLYLGKVFGPDGKQLNDWVTFRGRKRIIVRGSKNAGHRKCTDCGRDVYFAMGKKYLYPKPPDDTIIFEKAGGGGMIVNENLYSQLNLGKWSKLDIKNLVVVNAPKDGLGELANP